MRDAGAVHADEVGAVDVLGPAGSRVVGDGLLRLAVGVAEDAGPLLHGLVEVLRVDGGVGRAMVDEHLGALARVARVHVEGRVRPHLLRVDGLALGAGRVPAINGARVEAACGHSSVGRAGGEQFRVRGGHDVGHHGAGAGTGEEDLAGVGTVLFDGVGNHLRLG